MLMRDNKKEIIVKLVEKGEEKPTINQLSQETGIRYKNVYDIIKKLEEEFLIKTEKIGNSLQCSLIKKMHPLLFDAEFHRRKILTKNSDFKVIQNRLNSLNFSFIILLFGSHAKKTSVKGSDIDIMVIGEKNRERDFENIFSIIPLNIHHNFFTYEEFITMAQSYEFSVVKEAIKNNVILIGIEDYYRLMENVERRMD